MKKTLLLTSLIFIFAFQSIAQLKKKALFIGNSYTYVNNLPQMVYDVALSNGDTLIFNSSMPGGYTFEQHTVLNATQNLISAGGWDFVVLQEQSQRPAFPIGQVQTDVFPYAHALDSMINVHNPCGETMFYMTWGRKNGDASNCASYPPICTYAGMDSLLHARYMIMANDNQAVVSPVGAVWKSLRQNNPSIELYDVDESHPILAGSYAAACSFYAAIFRKNPMDITYDAGLPSADAAAIRLRAKEVVFDSLMKWHIGEYDTKADFDFTDVGNGEFNFANTSVNASTYSWNFGDGDTSNSENPSHTYSSDGDFTVTLTVTHCDSTSVYSEVVHSTLAGINQVASAVIQAFPNPFEDILNLNLLELNQVQVRITNISGAMVFNKSYESGTQLSIDASSLPAGMYFLNIQSSNFDSPMIQKLVKTK